MFCVYWFHFYCLHLLYFFCVLCLIVLFLLSLPPPATDHYHDCFDDQGSEFLISEFSVEQEFSLAGIQISLGVDNIKITLYCSALLKN